MIPRAPILILVLSCAFLGLLVSAAPMPQPIQNVPSPVDRASKVSATPAPKTPTPDASPDDILQFYKPLEQWAQKEIHNGDKHLVQRESEWSEARREARDLARDRWQATPVEKRGDVPTVPLSEMPYPSFPAQYPSCYNCQQKYSSLSSCMEASSVFQNASSIFNSPWSYISVIKCACTDTFQAVYPQCVQCFQMTNQCQYLGTDPVGTGAPAMVTNIRSICAFGSSLLGGAEAANYPDYNNTYTPSTVPGYYDVTTTGPGYYDQATGAIFGGAMQTSAASALPFLVTSLFAALLTILVL